MSHDAPPGHFDETPGRYPGVDAVWTRRAGGATREWVPADGCADLIVRINATGHIHAMVYRPVVTAHRAALDPDERLIGVRLRAGWAASLLSPDLAPSPLAPASSPRAQASRPTPATAPPLPAWVTDLLAGQMQPDLPPATLEAWVAERIDAAGSPPTRLLDFLGLATESHGTARLSTLRFSHSGERQLQRAAKQWLGVTPKSFMRILRARSAREAIVAGRPLAGVAADFGYADQAHLTRDCRAILGRTPQQLRAVGFLQDLRAPSI